MLKQKSPSLISKLCLFVLLTFSSLLVNAGALEQLFAPEAKLLDVWLTHNPQSSLRINHDNWASFLKTNVKQGSDGINRIAYAKVTEKNQQLLGNYIRTMQTLRISDYNRDEQLAYWINLYNALTVKIVLDHYPVESIRDIDISPGFFSDGPWGKRLVTVEARPLSLNNIEHGILRPIWKDPRIHYAVNCASTACPNLSAEAYLASTMNAQLDRAAKQYIAHPRAVRITEEGVVVSSIYSWFQGDFGEQESDVIKHIQAYATPALSKKLQGTQFFADDEYDWSLNDVTEASD